MIDDHQRNMTHLRLHADFFQLAAAAQSCWVERVADLRPRAEGPRVNAVLSLDQHRRARHVRDCQLVARFSFDTIVWMNVGACRTHGHLVFIIRCLTEVREMREGTLTVHRRRSRQNERGKKLLKLSTVRPKFRIARGLIHPSQADEPRYFGPFFGGGRSETHMSKNAHDACAAFRFNRCNTAGNPVILARPSVQCGFQSGTSRVSATSNEMS